MVLRVAEVCQFQEKLLRQLAACSMQQKAAKGGGKRQAAGKQVAADQFGNAYCEGDAYSVNPIQISFGTGLLLRNSNLDGNMKLMIRTEIPRAQRSEAIATAVEIMNTVNKLGDCEVEYGAVFSDADMLAVADVYLEARQRLARFFDFLPKDAQQRFYNYNDAVTKYETEDLKEEGIERMKS